MNLVKEGHPALKEICESVEPGDLELPVLIQKMKETCQTHGGVGLAANQVGVTKRVIVINTNKTKMVLVNPAIVQTRGKKIPSNEGCLSFPHQRARTMRHQQIWVEYDEPMKLGDERQKRKFKGLDAIVVQHEVDHLDGLSMHDREKMV